MLPAISQEQTWLLMVAGQLGESVAMKCIGIIQARMSSTRLPGKIFAPIASQKPLLEVLVRRLASAKLPLWLATSDTRADHVTAAWGEALGLKVFRGSEDDVLSRFAHITAKEQPDWVVRITADDPFMDGKMVRHLINMASGADNQIKLIGDPPPNRHFPLGYIPQIVRGPELIRLDETLPQHSHHRIHVTSGIEGHHTARFTLEGAPARSAWRWTVDTVEDLDMARAVFDLLGDDWEQADYHALVKVLDANPVLTACNAHVQQKALSDG